MRKLVLLLGFIMVLGVVFTPSCTYDYLEDITIIDSTGNPIDTTGNPIDTSDLTIDTSGVPCDPNVIYFNSQVLPILVSNCAMSGCHSVASHEDGVILTDYAHVMQTADVSPFNANGSDLYEVLVETDPDKIMPPNGPLSAADIAIIQNWINQGAQNLECNPNYGQTTGCDTTNVSYSAKIQPVIQTNCVGCHNGPGGSGGIDLSNWNAVKNVANTGKLVGSIKGLPGFSAMPPSGNPLSSCTIARIEAWVNAGAPNN